MQHTAENTQYLSFVPTLLLLTKLSGSVHFAMHDNTSLLMTEKITLCKYSVTVINVCCVLLWFGDTGFSEELMF